MKTINERAKEFADKYGVPFTGNACDISGAYKVGAIKQREIDYAELRVRMCDWYCNHCEVQSDCSSDCHDITSIQRIFEL